MTTKTKKYKKVIFQQLKTILQAFRISVKISIVKRSILPQMISVWPTQKEYLNSVPRLCLKIGRPAMENNNDIF